MFELICIQFITVFIIDICGFVDSVKYGISWILTKGKLPTTNYTIKPFDCSLCSTFWLCLIYLVVCQKLTLPYLAFICLLAGTTIQTKNIFYLIGDVIDTIINKITNLISK